MKYTIFLFLALSLFSCNNKQKERSTGYNKENITLLPDSAFSTEYEGKKIGIDRIAISAAKEYLNESCQPMGSR